jgi:hypothetical protein
MSADDWLVENEVRVDMDKENSENPAEKPKKLNSASADIAIMP